MLERVGGVESYPRLVKEGVVFSHQHDHVTGYIGQVEDGWEGV